MAKEKHVTWSGLVARFKSETPKFWRVIRANAVGWGLAIEVFAGILVSKEGIPLWIQGVGNWLIIYVPVISGLIVLLSSLTVNPDTTSSTDSPK